MFLITIIYIYLYPWVCKTVRTRSSEMFLLTGCFSHQESSVCVVCQTINHNALVILNAYVTVINVQICFVFMAKYFVCFDN